MTIYVNTESSSVGVRSPRDWWKSNSRSQCLSGTEVLKCHYGRKCHHWHQKSTSVETFSGRVQCWVGRDVTHRFADENLILLCERSAKNKFPATIGLTSSLAEYIIHYFPKTNFSKSNFLCCISKIKEGSSYKEEN